jgi:hypothetical protein
MSAAPKIRVAHPFAHFAKGWGIARSATLLGIALIPILSHTAKGQLPCGLTSIKDSVPLSYPPIARAAHMQGRVIALVQFDPSGSVKDLSVISGPEMLRTATTEYLKGLHVNEFEGSRECPLVVDFNMNVTPPCENSAAPAVPFERTDLQHVVIHTATVWLCDPALDLHRRKRFILF